jgi:hypothetical protein
MSTRAQRYRAPTAAIAVATELWMGSHSSDRIAYISRPTTAAPNEDRRNCGRALARSAVPPD